MKVTNIRYFTARRGLGYIAETDTSTVIRNEGNGAGTYNVTLGEVPACLANRTGRNREEFLERLINEFEKEQS